MLREKKRVGETQTLVIMDEKSEIKHIDRKMKKFYNIIGDIAT